MQTAVQLTAAGYIENNVAKYACAVDIELKDAHWRTPRQGGELKICDHCKYCVPERHEPLCQRFRELINGGLVPCSYARDNMGLCGINGICYEISDAWKEATEIANGNNGE